MLRNAALVASLGVIASGVTPAAEMRWDKFNKPPLTILYPEETSLSNPPFLHWQSDPRAARYQIDLVGAGVEEHWAAERNFFTPPAALKPGYYTVRIAAQDANAKVLLQSDLREFRLPADRPQFVPPSRDPKLPKGRPIAYPPEVVEAVRAATEPRAELRDRLLRLAREPRPETLNAPAEPAPYTNNTWNFDEWNKNNTFCGNVEDYVAREAAAYRLTGEERFARNAIEVLLPVAHWDPVGSTGIWSNDHSAWSILHSLAIGYSLVGDRMNADEKSLIAAAIEARCRDLYAFLNPFVFKDTSAGPMNDPDNNHPWFCAAALGIGALALRDQLPEANEWVDFTTQLFCGVFLPRGGRNGGWHEGIDYWSYMLYFVFQYCDALQATTGANLYEHPWLKHTAFFKIYVHPPRGGFVPFGDCKQKEPTAFDKLIMMRLASQHRDPIAWRYVDAIPREIDNNRLVYAVLWSDRSGVDMSKTVECPFAVEFPDIGWVVSNSDVFDPDDQVVFAFRSGKFYGRRFNHSHADQNGYILAAGGDKLLWDAGYYDSYLSAHHRQYSSQSIAHNVILVGGQGQVAFTRGTDGKIAQFETHGESLHVQGDASTPIIYGGRVYQWLRTIDYQDKKTLTVSDDIWLADTDTASWLLHSAYPIVYNPGDRTIEIVGDHYRLSAVFETDVPVEAILTTAFPVAPGQVGKLYTDQRENPFKDEYHLELRTVNKLERWKPVFRATLQPLAPAK